MRFKDGRPQYCSGLLSHISTGNRLDGVNLFLIGLPCNRLVVHNVELFNALLTDEVVQHLGQDSNPAILDGLDIPQSVKLCPFLVLVRGQRHHSCPRSPGRRDGHRQLGWRRRLQRRRGSCALGTSTRTLMLPWSRVASSPAGGWGRVTSGPRSVGWRWLRRSPRRTTGLIVRLVVVLGLSAPFDGGGSRWIGCAGGVSGRPPWTVSVCLFVES